MSQLLPAIAIMDRPTNHPDLASGPHKAWEMRPVTGSAEFMAYAPRIVTDDALRAASAFATDLAVHAQRTGTRPWLILPDAAIALRAVPASHRRLICTDQPAAAILKPDRLSARVDENRSEEPSLIADLRNGSWKLYRHDPVIREAGRIRLLCSVAIRQIELPDITSVPPEINDRIALGNWARNTFWSHINPLLGDPFAHGLNDPALEEATHSWLRGDADLLSERLKMIAWTEGYLSDVVFPFEVQIDTAIDEHREATPVFTGPMRASARPLIAEALKESHPIGWKLRRELDDPLPRRSDWRRVPLRFSSTIPAPSAHERLAAHIRLATWLEQRGLPASEHRPS